MVVAAKLFRGRPRTRPENFRGKIRGYKIAARHDAACAFCSVWSPRHYRMMYRPTPTQMALSATLNAGQ